MAEKKGNTGKLIFDFNTAANLEVFLPELNVWARVTAFTFRSYGGLRRISQEINKEYITENYHGPIYYFYTNSIVENPISGTNYPEGYIHKQPQKKRFR